MHLMFPVHPLACTPPGAAAASRFSPLAGSTLYHPSRCSNHTRNASLTASLAMLCPP